MHQVGHYQIYEFFLTFEKVGQLRSCKKTQKLNFMMMEENFEKFKFIAKKKKRQIIIFVESHHFASLARTRFHLKGIVSLKMDHSM